MLIASKESRRSIVYIFDANIQTLYIEFVNTKDVFMSLATVNISFNKELLKQIDRVAKEEVRTRSELIREASRMYLERKKKWENLFSYGKKIALENGISQKDIFDEIKVQRRKK
jgi:predicted transcriptional regulator